MRKRSNCDLWLRAKKIYSLNLERSSKARRFLRKWRITEDIAKKFGLGFAQPDLASYCERYGLRPEDLLQTGLCFMRHGKLVDVLAGRLVFPIEARGRVVGFWGRALKPGAAPIYRSVWRGRKDYLYNEKAVRATAPTTLVEGIRDTLCLSQQGVEAVALLNPLHLGRAIQILKRSPEVKICFPGDRVGFLSARKLASRLGRRARILKLPWGRDIASMISAMEVERLYVISEKLVYDRMRVIEKTLRDYGITARVVDFEVGSTATTYELELTAGTPIHKVAARADTLSRRLSVPWVRILAQVPERLTVGIEVPNPAPKRDQG